MDGGGHMTQPITVIQPRNEKSMEWCGNHGWERSFEGKFKDTYTLNEGSGYNALEKVLTRMHF